MNWSKESNTFIGRLVGSSVWSQLDRNRVNKGRLNYSSGPLCNAGIRLKLKIPCLSASTHIQPVIFLLFDLVINNEPLPGILFSFKSGARQSKQRIFFIGFNANALTTRNLCKSSDGRCFGVQVQNLRTCDGIRRCSTLHNAT